MSIALPSSHGQHESLFHPAVCFRAGIGFDSTAVSQDHTSGSAAPVMIIARLEPVWRTLVRSPGLSKGGPRRSGPPRARLEDGVSNSRTLPPGNRGQPATRVVEPVKQEVFRVGSRQCIALGLSWPDLSRPSTPSMHR